MINKIIKVNSQYKDRVKSFIIDRKLYIKPNFNPIQLNNSIEWNTEGSLSKTEIIYLHSLLIIKDLIKYLITEKIDYSAEALQIIEEWWEINEKNEVAWNEHAVAERTLNLLYFQENSSIKIKDKKFNRIISAHLEYLYDSKNYKSNNHGLMMDRTLLIGSYYSDNSHFRERAIDRFYLFIYRDFSTSGIHLENSPEYHSLTLKLIHEFTITLQALNIKVDKDINEIIKKAELYLPRIARPDNTIPMLGDSGYKKLTEQKSFANIIDHTSGTYLYQDNNKRNWLLVTNGYQSKTHKHKDDMGVQFSIGNMNILVDSGKYNYDANSQIRKYLISDKAHSKPYILERRYKFDGKDRLKSNIILNNNEIYHIEVSYFKPGDFNIIRNIILHKETSSLFFIDRFASKEILTHISNFVFDPELDIIIHPPSTASIKNSDYSIYFHDSKIKLISNKNEQFNWYSSHFNEYEKTNRVFARTKGNNALHVSYLKSDIIKTNIEINENNIELQLNGQKHYINISKIERW